MSSANRASPPWKLTRAICPDSMNASAPSTVTPTSIGVRVVPRGARWRKAGSM
jgi:hypothetical protein